MKCVNSDCGADVVHSQRFCVACGADVGAPNVRAANESTEITALGIRYSTELSKAHADGYEAEFVKFSEICGKSRAIICMSPAKLVTLATDSASLIATFGLQVESQSRVPLDNRFDSIRASVEEAYFPNYSKEIRFAALSLIDVGHAAYGSCSITLKDSSIANRASVFEHPLFKFSADKGVKLSEPIPAGHRSSWDGRGKLAAVKFGANLKGLSDADMAALLLPEPTDTLSDCIEVHVYGPLNRHSISGVVLTSVKRRPDKLIQQAIAEEFDEIGVPVRFVA